MAAVTGTRSAIPAVMPPAHEIQPKAYVYNPAALCGLICTVLSKTPDTIPDNSIPDKIVQSSPEILFDLSCQEPDELAKLVKAHIHASEYPKRQKKYILPTVKILYSTSLINSNIGTSAKELETSEAHYKKDRNAKSQLRAMIVRSEKSHLNQLIEDANTLLSVPLPAKAEDLNPLSIKVTQMTTEVHEVLNLFFHHDLLNRTRFENLFRYSDKFPGCKRLFPHLMQNLDICQNERDVLVRLQKDLTSRAKQIRQRIAEIQLPRVQALPESREKMLEHQAVLLWECGADLLEQGLKNVFSDKLTYPDEFRNAVNAVSQRKEFRAFHFNALLENRIEPLLPQYVCAVWDHYLGQDSPIVDISDLMRVIVGRLPEEVFTQLEADLKTSADRKSTIMTVVDQHFRTEFGGENFTLIALRKWLYRS